MEYLEVFDEQNQPLGLHVPRNQVHEQGLWHRTVQVYVLHPAWGYLCHQRSQGKDLFPLLWDISIGGHLNPGETYEACAVRELAEELGLAVPPAELTFVGVETIDGKDEAAGLLDREHVGIFLYRTSAVAQELVFQQEEITQLAYLTIPHLKAELRSNTPEKAYVPLQAQFLKILERLDALVTQP